MKTVILNHTNADPQDPHQNLAEEHPFHAYVHSALRIIMSKAINSPFSDLSFLFLLTPGMTGVPNSLGRIQLIGGITEMSTSEVQTKAGIGKPLSMVRAVRNCIGTRTWVGFKLEAGG